MTALHEAARSFTEFGYAQFVAHYPIRWDRINTIGRGTEPLATIGVVFHLDDADDREVCLAIDLWFRDEQFVVGGEASVDDPHPDKLGAVDQRCLLDLPDIRTPHLNECLAALRDYTARLCSYTSVLDDVGVSREH